MPVPSGNPIKLSDLVAEFGSDGSPSLRDYYRGGPRVPNSGTNAAISTDPASLRLTQFYGAANFSVAVPSQTVSHSVGYPTVASAGIGFYTDGSVTFNAGNSHSGPSYWGNPVGGSPGNGYQMYVSKASGSTPSGSALDTWLPLSSPRTFTIIQSTVGYKSCTLNVTIATYPGGTTVSTGTITIEAESG
jgi:hypothetical protein